MVLSDISLPNLLVLSRKNELHWTEQSIYGGQNSLSVINRHPRPWQSPKTSTHFKRNESPASQCNFTCCVLQPKAILPQLSETLEKCVPEERLASTSNWNAIDLNYWGKKKTARLIYFHEQTWNVFKKLKLWTLYTEHVSATDKLTHSSLSTISRAPAAPSTLVKTEAYVGCISQCSHVRDAIGCHNMVRHLK